MSEYSEADLGLIQLLLSIDPVLGVAYGVTYGEAVLSRGERANSKHRRQRLTPLKGLKTHSCMTSQHSASPKHDQELNVVIIRNLTVSCV